MAQISTLKNNPEFYEQVLNLIEQEFNYQKKNKFDLDFYPLINKNNWENCFLLLNENKDFLIGHIGIKERYFKYNSELIKSALIGGIAIHHQFQKKGYFTSFFDQLLENLKNKYDVMILWSEQEKLYQRFGFNRTTSLELNSLEHDTIHYLKKNGYNQTKLANLTVREFSQIKKLYEIEIENKFLCPRRESNNWDEIIKTSTIDLLLKKEDDQIISYCFVNKGQDLINFIHEYAISKNHLQEYGILKNCSGLFYHDDSKNSKNQVPIALVKYNNSTLGNKDIFNKLPLFISGADSI